MSHAQKRLKERYGFWISKRDMKALAERCAKGEGHVETMASGMQKHALILGERIVWAIYAPWDTVIVTILDPNAAIGVDFRARRNKFKRLHGFAKEPRRPALEDR